MRTKFGCSCSISSILHSRWFTIRLLPSVRNMTLPFFAYAQQHVSKALTHRISSYLTFSHFSSVFTKKPSLTTYGLCLLSSPKSKSSSYFICISILLNSCLLCKHAQNLPTMNAKLKATKHSTSRLT